MEKIFSSPELVEHVAGLKKGNVNVFYRDGILKNDNTTKSGVRFVTKSLLLIKILKNLCILL